MREFIDALARTPQSTIFLVALGLTGTLGARLGKTPHVARAAVRVVVGGALALGATFLIGSLLGVSAA